LRSSCINDFLEKREPLTEIKWIKDGQDAVHNSKKYFLDPDSLLKDALPVGVSVFIGGEEVGETTKVSRAFRDNKSVLCIKPVQARDLQKSRKGKRKIAPKGKDSISLIIEAILNQYSVDYPVEKRDSELGKIMDCLLELRKSDEITKHNYPGLRVSLPFSTPDNKPLGQSWEPLFYYPPLGKVYPKFEAMLRTSAAAIEQNRTIILLKQTSGFGKTMLCHSLGHDGYVVIITIPPKEKFALYNVLDALVSRVPHNSLKQVTETKACEFFQLLKNLVAIWVFAFIEFRTYFDAAARLYHCSDKEKYEYFRRSVVSTIGRSAINNIFFSKIQLAHPSNKKKFEEYQQRIFSTPLKCLVLDEVVNTHNKFIGYFPHDRYKDNLHMPENQRQIHIIEIETQKTTSPFGGPTDLLYAFTSVTRTLLRENIPTVFASTHFASMQYLLDRPLTEERALFGVFQEFETLTLHDLKSYLALVFDGSYKGKEWNDLLRPFCARPLFFFQDFVFASVEDFKSLPRKDTENQVKLSLKKAIIRSIRRVKTWYTNFKSEISQRFLEKLYYCVVMHFGFLDNFNDFDANAVAHGIASIVNIGTKDVWKINEEIVVDAIMSEELTFVEKSEPTKSLLFKTIGSFSISTTNIGQIAEWIIAAIYFRAARLHCTILPYLKPLDSLGVGESTFLNTIQFCIKSCASYDELVYSNKLEESSPHLVFPICFNNQLLIFPSKELKPDIISFGQTDNGTFPIPVLTQIKGHSAPLADDAVIVALQSIHPCNFFRTVSLTNANIQRGNFLSWWQQYDHKCTQPLFSQCVRVLISFGGFKISDDLMTKIIKHNEEHPKQPILLLEWNSMKEHVGTLASNRALQRLGTESKARNAPEYKKREKWEYLGISDVAAYKQKYSEEEADKEREKNKRRKLNKKKQ